MPDDRGVARPETAQTALSTQTSETLPRRRPERVRHRALPSSSASAVMLQLSTLYKYEDVGAKYEEACSLHPDPEAFVNGLISQGLDAKHFLTLCFRENDYNLALKETYGLQPREVVKTVFDYAVTSTAKVDSIMRIVDAAAITERDLIHGVNENIAIANFVRLCMEGYTETLYQ